MSRLRWVLGLSFGLVGACGDNIQPPPGPCWPLDASPGGQVEIGTGDIAFEPMPSVLTIIANGSQSDPFLEIYGRIQGIPPGDPANFLDPANPKTKVTAFIADLNLMLGVMCPASIGYVPSPDVQGAYDMLHSLRIGLGTLEPAAIAGHQTQLTIEVVGANGLYARDEKTVVLAAAIPADAGVGDDAVPNAIDTP